MFNMVKKCMVAILFAAGSSFGIISNEVERIVGFEFIRYEIDVEVWNAGGSGDLEVSSKLNVKVKGEIKLNDSLMFLNGIDSVKNDENPPGLCGCDGCGYQGSITFRGLAGRKLKVKYGGCGNEFDAAEFKFKNKTYSIHYNETQETLIGKYFRLLIENEKQKLNL